MSKFFNEHPIIALVMVGFICEAVIETAYVMSNGERSKKIVLFDNKKEENKESKVESVKE